MNRTCKTTVTRRRCFTRQMSKAILIALFMAVQCIWCANSIAQVTKTWVPANGGNWDTNSNWNPSGVPSASDVILINSDQSNPITWSTSNNTTYSYRGLIINGNVNIQFNPGSANVSILHITETFEVANGKTLTIGINNTGRLNFELASSASGIVNGTVFINSYSGSGYNRSFINNGDLSVTTSGLITGQNSSIFTLNAGATLRIGNANGITISGASGAIQNATRTYSAGANYIYNGTANQVTGNGLTQNQPANVTINNPGNTVSLSASRTISGNLSILAGTYDLQGFTMNRSTSGGTLSISDGATLRIGGTNSAPTGFSTRSFAANSTVEYYGAAQSIGTETFGNLLISAGSKSTTGNVAVIGNLTISSGAGLSTAHSWEIAGNWTNNGTFSQSSGIVTFNGTSQVLAGSTVTAFQTLTIAAGSTVTGATAPNPGTFNISNGGKYIHTATTAVVPGGTKNFDPSSTYEWQGTNNFPSVPGITFGNLIINSASGNNNATGRLTTVLGDLVIHNTAGGSYRLVGSSDTEITISGNLIVENGQLNFSSTTGTPVVTVNGDVVLNGGVLRPQLSSGIPEFEVKGNWLNNYPGSFTPGSGTVTFNGSAAQSIGGSASTTFNNLTLGNTAEALTFATATTVINSLSLATGAIANLGAALSHTAGTLTMGSFGRAAGTWGHPSSGAGFTSTTFFADANGTLTVANSSCTAPAFTVLAGPISCHGAANGSITITAGGGSGIFEYSINNGASWHNENIFNGLGPDTYTILVKDKETGCVQTNCE